MPPCQPCNKVLHSHLGASSGHSSGLTQKTPLKNHSTRHAPLCSAQSLASEVRGGFAHRLLRQGPGPSKSCKQASQDRDKLDLVRS